MYRQAFRESRIKARAYHKTDTPPRATDCDARLTDRLATVLLISLSFSVFPLSYIHICTANTSQPYPCFVHDIYTEPLTIRSYNDNDGVDNDD